MATTAPRSSSPKRVVIIGGDAAGMSAASQAIRVGGDAVAIVAFERGSRTSYAACGLPYFVAGDVGDADELIARSPEEHRARGIDLRTRTEVMAIDTTARRVRVRNIDSGAETHEAYDELLIATGGLPVRPPVPGIDGAGIFDLRTVDDALALDAKATRGHRAVVVGGGYIGIEVAEALLQRGLHVTLVERDAQPMHTLDAEMGERVANAMLEASVDLRRSEHLVAFEHDADGVRSVVTSGGTIDADIVVIGLGLAPNTALALDADIPIGAAGGLVVDRRMRTPIEGVWAAGDVVESRHRVSGASVVVALGTHANKQGRTAGTNIAGGDASFAGVIGTAIARFCDLEIARTGLSSAEAAAAGFKASATTTTGATRAGYFPGAGEAHVRLIIEDRTGRVLGGQIVGAVGAGKRIDTLAVAIWNEMTVEDLAGVDLAYAPPFSAVWDPVLLAAGRMADARRR